MQVLHADETVNSISFDPQGRMKYHPDFHGNQKLPWTVQDQKYLIENYDLLGPEQISLALERTINTVMRRACNLRKQGLMTKPAKRSNHKHTISPN
jgi:hypothetical protein